MGRQNEVKRVLVGVPSWGVSPPEATEYRVLLSRTHARWQALGEVRDFLPDEIKAKVDPCEYQFEYAIVADILVQLARDQLCTAAVKGGFDYVAMIDDDMDGPSDLWKRLLAHDVDIVAPLAFMRSEPHYPVIYAMRGGWAPGSSQFIVRPTVVRNYPKNQLVECDAVGFGAVLINTRVLKGMEGWFFNTCATGEDVYFCTEARKRGFRVFCDTATKMNHLGPRRWVNEDTYETINPDIPKLRERMGVWNFEKSKENLVA